MMCLLLFVRVCVGLIQQFSENLVEAELVTHPAECLRTSSLLNQHSNQEELLKAVLLAGFYPNLIQVTHSHTHHVYIFTLCREQGFTVAKQ